MLQVCTVRVSSRCGTSSSVSSHTPWYIASNLRSAHGGWGLDFQATAGTGSEGVGCEGGIDVSLHEDMPLASSASTVTPIPACYPQMMILSCCAL